MNEKETPKTYHLVYFRIDAGYVWGQGMNPKDHQAFRDEVAIAFLHKGWSVIMEGFRNETMRVTKGASRLHVHPMELSGPCEDPLVPEVERILKNAGRLTLRATDTYDELLDIRPEDEMSYLRGTLGGSIDSVILDAFRTPSRDAYKHVSVTLMNISGPYDLKTVNHYLGRSCADSIVCFFRERFESLCAHGDIVTNGNDQARTAVREDRLDDNGEELPF